MLDLGLWGVPPANAPYSLLPVVVSTYGAWHPEFVRWVRRLLRDWASASAADEVEANGLLGGMLWRVGASLSVAAQRAVFRGLAACMPDLRAGGGQLGQPLSEEPEFWRAAPDATCIDWVAEELGLEPGRWDRPAAPQGPSAEGAALPEERRAGSAFEGSEEGVHTASPRGWRRHAARPGGADSRPRRPARSEPLGRHRVAVERAMIPAGERRGTRWL